MLEQRGAHDLVGGPFGQEFSLAEEHHAVGIATGGGEVVHRGKAGKPALTNQPSDELVAGPRMPNVQVGRGLVEQQHGCGLGKGASDVDPLPFTSGQGLDRAVRDALKLARTQCFFDDLGVIRPRLKPRALMRSAPHCDNLAHRETDRHVRSLGHEGDPLCELASRQRGDLVTRDAHPARDRRTETGHDPKERALAGPVWPKHHRQRSGLDGEPHVNQCRMGAMARAHRLEEHHRHPSTVPRIRQNRSTATLQRASASGDHVRQTFKDLRSLQASEMDTHTHGPSTKRIIKRYSNRKLYDTRDSRYVTLTQIGEMVRRGEDVQVIDNNSKEDKTEATLALILSEDLKAEPNHGQRGALRTLLQERSEKFLSSLRDGPIGRLLPGNEKAERASDAAPMPETDDATSASGEEAGRTQSKSRINDLVETSRHTLEQLQAALDDRVQAVVPGLGLIRGLRAELAAMNRRLEAIERQLGLPTPDLQEKIDKTEGL